MGAYAWREQKKHYRPWQLMRPMVKAGQLYVPEALLCLVKRDKKTLRTQRPSA